MKQKSPLRNTLHRASVWGERKKWGQVAGDEKVDQNILERAVDLGRRLGHIFIATTDDNGMPHLAAARAIDMEPEGRISVSEWFCPGTIGNLQQNKRISLVVWDSIGDVGYQLLGEMEKVRDLAFLDGFTREETGSLPPPNVERQLIVRVEKVLRFTQAPHSDSTFL